MDERVQRLLAKRSLEIRNTDVEIRSKFEVVDSKVRNGVRRNGAKGPLRGVHADQTPGGDDSPSGQGQVSALTVL